MLFPAIRPNIGVYRNSDQIEFEIYNEHKKISFIADNLAFDVISDFTGALSVEEIKERAQKKYGSNFGKNVDDICRELFKEGLILYKTERVPQSLSREADYLNAFPSKLKYDDQAVKKLINQRVVVIGAGGLGSNIVEILARMGVGNIKAVDFDKVGPENIANQSFYTEQDCGKYKVDCLSKYCNAINHKSVFAGEKRKLSTVSDIANVIAGYDFVFSCADYPSVKRISLSVSQACLQVGIPHIVGGGYAGHEAALGTMIIPGKTKSWEEYLRNSKEGPNLNQEIIQPNVKASFLPLVRMVAAIQTSEYVKYVIGNLDNLNMTNKFSEIDLNTLKISSVEF